MSDDKLTTEEREAYIEKQRQRAELTERVNVRVAVDVMQWSEGDPTEFGCIPWMLGDEPTGCFKTIPPFVVAHSFSVLDVERSRDHFMAVEHLSAVALGKRLSFAFSIWAVSDDRDTKEESAENLSWLANKTADRFHAWVHGTEEGRVALWDQPA